MGYLSGHTKKDLDIRKTIKALLSVAVQEFIIVESEAIIEGAYIFYDRENSKFVRSGKASYVLI